MKPALIDIGVIASFRDLEKRANKKILKVLIDLFLESTPLELKLLSEHLESGDYDSLCRGFHSLKSSCGNLGVTGMSECAAKGEEHLYEQSQKPKADYDRNLLIHSIQSLETSFHDVRPALLEIHAHEAVIG